MVEGITCESVTLNAINSIQFANNMKNQKGASYTLQIPIESEGNIAEYRFSLEVSSVNTQE